MKIVFFYSRLQPYLLGIVQSLLAYKADLEIFIFYFDSTNVKYLIDYKFSGHVHLYNKKSFGRRDLLEFLKKTNPDILYLSGWMDKDYLLSSIRFKKLSFRCKTVIGIDDLWFGSFRQIVGSVLYKLFLKRYIDYLWVAGSPQYHYARNFGYSDKEIISCLLPGNSLMFKEQAKFSKRLVFVGRNVWEKNLNLLVQAYIAMPIDFKNQWPLYLYGPSKDEFNLIDSGSILFFPDIEPVKLSEELSFGGVLIFPSISEKWGVVVHELASIGYPLILSDVCGSMYDLLINGYNGFKFESNSKDSLIMALYNLQRLSLDNLIKMSDNSIEISKKYNSGMAAHSLLSIIYNS